MISVITVVLNDLVGLVKTVESVAYQKKINPNIEYIVIDGASSDGSLEYLESNMDVVDVLVSEPDGGIYFAMNKGLNLATGSSLIFMNAGDYFVGDVLMPWLSAPVFLPVKYVDIIGRFRNRPIESVYTGIPNCHQGIIFENKRIQYDVKYKISADYKYFVEHGYGNQISMAGVEGYIYFDNTGVNGKNIILRDREILQIRSLYFGFLIGYIFEAWPTFKRLARAGLKMLRRG